MEETKPNTPDTPEFFPEGSREITIKQFFEAWPISKAVLAERLRRNGVKVTRKQLEEGLKKEPDQITPYERALLTAAASIIAADLKKIKDIKF